MIKYIIFSLLSLLLLLFGFIVPSREHILPRGEELVNITLAKTAKIIKEKYKIRPCGVGVAMCGGPIQELTLCFSTDFPHSKEQLRTLLIKSAQELVLQVTENKEIQEHLKKPPFVIKNVQIIIYNHKKDGSEVYDPGISTADISNEILTFSTVDSLNTFRYKNEFEETYEEALEKMRG